MVMGLPPADEERLPWLEPYRDSVRPGSKPKAAKPKSRGGWIAAVGGVAVLAAAGGGYWFGQRGDPSPGPPPTRMAEAPVATAPASQPVVSPTTSAPAPTPVVESPPPSPTPVRAEPAPPKKVTAKPARKPVRRADRQRKIRSAGIENARIREVRAAQERGVTVHRSAPRPIIRANARPWPKMPSPGPAGQVVQLGAFRTQGRALAAYRVRLARYPVLGSMPRVVVPVITRPRGQVLYVLRLGTSSRQQSGIVCRNLRASGDHCIVIG